MLIKIINYILNLFGWSLVKVKERFKRITGYEEEYVISSFGRVIRIYKSGKFYELKWMKKPNGYYKVELWKNNKREDKYIHRLVAEHFIENDDPILKMDVGHEDDKKGNNRIYNLKWVTHLENMQKYFNSM